ncbi:MAG TPA: hypothetical protein VKE24_05455 [Candidatus Acidoferrales bacterium]|nr:hypothetical protein [Candidatus Acidoferrales bacterium]
MDTKRHFTSEWLLLIFVFALLAYLGVAGGSEVVTWAERPKAGSLAELSDDGPLLRIASDENTFEQASKAEAAKDEQRLEELLRSEKIFLVPNGTKVRVLNVDGTKAGIKILEGPHMNRVGHVPVGWVKAR